MPIPAARAGRRDFLRNAVSVAGAAGIARFAGPAVTALTAVAARAQPGASRLVLLGTQGGPNFNTERGESASALVVDGAIHLIDCGYGTLAALRRAGLVYRDIGHVFLTHLHDDHTGDVAALVSHQWSDGRIEPTRLFGPYGTDAMLDAALAFSRANTDIRVIDEARTVRPEALFSATVLEATRQPARAWSDERVIVTSIENTHYPEESKREMPHRSLAYRFDCPDHSIVFSGDTAYSENLIELARGADMLVCEAIEVASMRRAFEGMVAGGAYADNAEGVWAHIVGTHTSTEDAGRMAAAAGVRRLVLNHLVPGALADIGDDAYRAGAARHFDGDIVIGDDQMVL